MNRHLTFSEILARTASENAARLMARARLANRMAKRLEREWSRVESECAGPKGKRRQVAALQGAVQSSRWLASREHIGSAAGRGFSLHAPAAQFGLRRNDQCAA